MTWFQTPGMPYSNLKYTDIQFLSKYFVHALTNRHCNMCNSQIHRITFNRKHKQQNKEKKKKKINKYRICIQIYTHVRTLRFVSIIFFCLDFITFNFQFTSSIYQSKKENILIINNLIIFYNFLFLSNSFSFYLFVASFFFSFNVYLPIQNS